VKWLEQVGRRVLDEDMFAGVDIGVAIRIYVCCFLDCVDEVDAATAQ
jgi:hypothetical protein